MTISMNKLVRISYFCNGIVTFELSAQCFGTSSTGALDGFVLHDHNGPASQFKVEAGTKCDVARFG